MLTYPTMTISLTLGQQVVFQSLELQEVPILPTKVVVSLLPVSLIFHQRENPGSAPKFRLIQSLQQATPPFRCSVVFPGLTYMTYLSLLFSNLWQPRLGTGIQERTKELNEKVTIPFIFERFLFLKRN